MTLRLRLRGHARPAVILVVAAMALSAPAPNAIAAVGSPTARAAAAKKKKKTPLTATVNGTFTARQDDPDGFGNDAGPNWQQLKVVIEAAKIPFSAPDRQSASAEDLLRLASPPDAADGVQLPSQHRLLAAVVLMTDCLTVAANKPRGSWSLGWATPDGLGKLTSDGRGVPLAAINTDVNQTGSVTGSVKFNQSVNR